MMSSKDGRMSNILRRMYLWNGWCPGENDQLFDTDLQHTAINVRRSEQFVLAWAAGGEPREWSEPVGSAERGRAAAPAPGRSACGVVHRRRRVLPARGQGPSQVPLGAGEHVERVAEPGHGRAGGQTGTIGKDEPRAADRGPAILE